MSIACTIQGEDWMVMNITIDKDADPTWLIEGAITRGKGKSEYLLLFRTSAGHIYSSTSQDDGMHWTPATTMPLPNPNSKVLHLLMTAHIVHTI